MTALCIAAILFFFLIVFFTMAFCRSAAINDRQLEQYRQQIQQKGQKQ